MSNKFILHICYRGYKIDRKGKFVNTYYVTQNLNLSIQSYYVISSRHENWSSMRDDFFSCKEFQYKILFKISIMIDINIIKLNKDNIL